MARCPSRTSYQWYTVYPKKYAHGFCFAVLCCGFTLTDFSISIRFTSLALWQSNDCPSANKATLMNIDKYFMWIHYERLHNHNKAKHNKTVCIVLATYCMIALFSYPCMWSIKLSMSVIIKCLLIRLDDFGKRLRASTRNMNCRKNNRRLGSICTCRCRAHYDLYNVPLNTLNMPILSFNLAAFPILFGSYYTV